MATKTPCKMVGVTSQSYKGKTCASLAGEATTTRNELARRVAELKENKNDLPAFGKNSVKGHIEQVTSKQANLRGVLQELAARKGTKCCSDDNTPEDAWQYASAPSPVPVPVKVAAALGLTALVIGAFLATPAVAAAGVTAACLAAFVPAVAVANKV